MQCGYQNNPVSNFFVLPYPNLIKLGKKNEMPLPFLESQSIPNNREMAEKCLFSLKSKLLKNTQQKADYLKFMSEIISSGDGEVVVMNSASDKRESWYIPHFAVCHPNKPDSLNDHLLKGPNLMNRLVLIVHRLRKGRIGIMCDIQKMFHMF